MCANQERKESWRYKTAPPQKEVPNSSEFTSFSPLVYFIGHYSCEEKRH